MNTFLLSWIAILSMLIGPPPAKKPKYPDGLYAEVTTNKGLIVLQLEFEKTPMTVSNFVGLTEGTINNTALPPATPYFTGTEFHRVVPGHVIQCGIPSGATPDPGYQFPNEIVLPDLSHSKAGMLNMANSGWHTNGSQWCITLGDRSYLDGDYTVFGHVIKGMEVVMAIVQSDEILNIKIVRVGIAANTFHPMTESFKLMVEIMVRLFFLISSIWLRSFTTRSSSCVVKMSFSIIAFTSSFDLPVSRNTSPRPRMRATGARRL